MSDAIGQLIEFWGFKRNMGRVWTILYLSERPMSAKALQERLQLSSGAVSMTTSELDRWGVIKKVWIQGERKDFFAAETNLWKMISRVLSERERKEIARSIEAMEEALDFLAPRARSSDAQERERAKHQRDRIRQLLDLAKLGASLLDALVTKARVDVTPLTRILLGSKD